MRDIAGQRLTAARKAVQDVAASEDSAQGKRDKSPKLGKKKHWTAMVRTRCSMARKRRVARPARPISTRCLIRPIDLRSSL